jgi:hypothetical protein
VQQIHELQTAHALALEQIAVLKEELETIERTTEKQLTASLKVRMAAQKSPTWGTHGLTRTGHALMTVHATWKQAQEVLQSMEQTAVDNTHTTVLLENERNSLQGIVDTLQEQNELTIGERNLSEAVLQATLADSLKMQERIEKFKMEVRATLTYSHTPVFSCRM